MITTKVNAQELSLKLVEEHLSSFQKQIDIPDNYKPKSVKKVHFNDIDAYLFRYGKNKSKELMPEHFSFIVAEKSLKVLGFTLMDKKYSHLKMLSKKETEIIARDFFKNIDSSLNDELKNLWIEKHNEQIIVGGNEKITITGMKYKCFRPLKNDYAWVIVGFDGTIITYERDIKWNSKEHKRITNKWLHDNWIKSSINNN